MKSVLATIFTATFSLAYSKRDATCHAVTAFYASCSLHSLHCKFVIFVLSLSLSSASTPHANQANITRSLGPGYLLRVSDADATKNLTSTHHIASKELVVRDYGSVQYQSYTGPPDFGVQVA
ncbi:hypothetical protein TruAng_010088 [Truncatella angustata]|nr:hypothetical protein TruAng_010088 [Truncatella angustata]